MLDDKYSLGRCAGCLKWQPIKRCVGCGKSFCALCDGDHKCSDVAGMFDQIFGGGKDKE
ncbi:MAG: hypothetical protein GY841_04350 [FCB group bacterium]|nr:hypothetical protein [FCB group bacterium]